jgi:UTP--glucose-1-phosphate uridylyltransferase
VAAVITDAVVPVGGLGTRLLPATRSQPKEMLPVVDKPVVQYVVEELAATGIERLLFVTGRRKRAIEDHFDADPELDRGPLTALEILYTRQPRPAGLGDALRHAHAFAPGRPVVVALGDTIIAPARSGSGPPVLTRLISAFERLEADAAIAVETVSAEQVSRYGIVVLTAAGNVTDVLEKPASRETDSRLAIAARYVLGPRVRSALADIAPDQSGEIQLAGALRAVIADGGRIVAVPLAPGERRYDIGSVQSYCHAFLDYALTDPRFGAAMRNHARLLLGDHA